MGQSEWTPHFQPVPIPVADLPSGIRELSTLSDHTCALTRDGKTFCWGMNARGQLGDGTDFPHLAPVEVLGLDSDAVSVAAGRSHSCAATGDGAVWCWGDNSYGQLGDGTRQSSLLPVRVAQGSDIAVRVVTGFYHTCYQTKSGKVKCWGLNAAGMLGNGSSANSSNPVEVKLAEAASFIEAGDEHTCAITVDGSIYCWGSNFDGQLGNNKAPDGSVPVEVLWN
jgi:alpha-tubulin suppressor-like RCC1 family protein